MDDLTIINLLKNSGLNKIVLDDNFIYFEDPSCIFPAFDTFLDYAWVVIATLTAIMLFGWGVLYIKNGLKTDSFFNNIKSLILIFGVLSLTKPIVNMVYCGNAFERQCTLFGQQCETRRVSRTAVQELLDLRNKNFHNSDQAILYETFDVVDSGIIYSDSYQATEQVQNYSGDISSSVQISNGSYNLSSSTKKSVAVEHTKNETIYIQPDGSKIKRIGGTVSWRNNNPGNIIKSDIAYSFGAIGESGAWAVFPDEQTGLKAITRLFRSKNYRNLTMTAAINRYCPFGHGNNNPTAYTKKIVQTTGFSADKKMGDFTDEELMKIARTIQNIEQWSVGTEQKI